MFRNLEPEMETLRHLHSEVSHLIHEVYPEENLHEYKEAQRAFEWMGKVESWLFRAAITHAAQNQIKRGLAGAKRWTKSWKYVNSSEKAERILMKQVSRIPPSLNKDLIYLLNVSTDLEEEYQHLTSVGTELRLLGQAGQ